MGDRFIFGFANKADDTPIYLYSHWGGGDRVPTMAAAIEAARSRWDDPSYATRIAVSHIVGDAWRGETGFGLMTNPTEVWGDYDEVFVAIWSEQRVEVRNAARGYVIYSIGFSEFGEITPELMLDEV